MGHPGVRGRGSVRHTSPYEAPPRPAWHQEGSGSSPAASRPATSPHPAGAAPLASPLSLGEGRVRAQRWAGPGRSVRALPHSISSPSERQFDGRVPKWLASPLRPRRPPKEVPSGAFRSSPLPAPLGLPARPRRRRRPAIPTPTDRDPRAALDAVALRAGRAARAPGGGHAGGAVRAPSLLDRARGRSPAARAGGAACGLAGDDGAVRTRAGQPDRRDAGGGRPGRAAARRRASGDR
jgi:hypothetical protein